MRTLKPYLIAISLGLLFFSGIIRHDVDESAYTKLASEKQFDAVGEVRCNGEFKGSCVWIRDRFVLSAAHVFMEHDYKKDTILSNGRKLLVNTPMNARVIDPSRVQLIIKGQPFKVRKITMHTSYRDSSGAGAFDLAVLELEEAPKDLSAPLLNEKQNELGASVVGVGFGVFGIADKANEPDTEKNVSRKIAGQNTIDSLGGEKLSRGATLLFADFDHPSRTDCNKLGSSKPLPLEYICSGGDSGGALFRQVNGQWELIAICSGASINVEQLLATGYYGQIMEWTRVSVFSDWIAAQTK